MSYTGATFTNDDDDIVRLTLDESRHQEAEEEGRDLDRSRTGWVNVGAFAVYLETAINGDLKVEVYPCGAENETLAELQVTRQQALDAGTQDIDD